MNLPSTETIKELHRKYAPGPDAFNSVWEHVCIVSDIAEQLQKAKSLKVDADLVRVGCLLHDVGVYKLYDKDQNLDKSNYITHGILGYKILKDEGYPEYLCNFARNHIGVGVTKEDVQSQQLPLPVNDYIPATEEERLVTYADKFHSKPGIFNSVDYYKKFLSDKFGIDKAEKFEKMTKEFGVPDLRLVMQKFKYDPGRIR